MKRGVKGWKIEECYCLVYIPFMKKIQKWKFILFIFLSLNAEAYDRGFSRFLVPYARNALTHYEGGRLSKFFGIVGDNYCEVYASRLLTDPRDSEFTSKCLTHLKPELLESDPWIRRLTFLHLLHLPRTIVHDDAGRNLDETRSMLKTPEEVMEELKEEGEEVSSKKKISSYLKMARKELNADVIKMLDEHNLGEDLPKEEIPGTGLFRTPFYETVLTTYEMIKKEKVPVLVVRQNKNEKKIEAALFIPTLFPKLHTFNGYVYLHPDDPEFKDYLSKQVLVLNGEGTADIPLREMTVESILSYSAAVHGQRRPPKNQKNTPLKLEQTHLLAMRGVAFGYGREDPHRFLMKNVFADTLSHALRRIDSFKERESYQMLDSGELRLLSHKELDPEMTTNGVSHSLEERRKNLTYRQVREHFSKFRTIIEEVQELIPYKAEENENERRGVSRKREFERTLSSEFGLNFSSELSFLDVDNAHFFLNILVDLRENYGQGFARRIMCPVLYYNQPEEVQVASPTQYPAFISMANDERRYIALSSEGDVKEIPEKLMEELKTSALLKNMRKTFEKSTRYFMIPIDKLKEFFPLDEIEDEFCLEAFQVTNAKGVYYHQYLYKGAIIDEKGSVRDGLYGPFTMIEHYLKDEKDFFSNPRYKDVIEDFLRKFISDLKMKKDFLLRKEVPTYESRENVLCMMNHFMQELGFESEVIKDFLDHFPLMEANVVKNTKFGKNVGQKSIDDFFLRTKEMTDFQLSDFKRFIYDLSLEIAALLKDEELSCQNKLIQDFYRLRLSVEETHDILQLSSIKGKSSFIQERADIRQVMLERVHAYRINSFLYTHLYGKLSSLKNFKDKDVGFDPVLISDLSKITDPLKKSEEIYHQLKAKLDEYRSEFEDNKTFKDVEKEFKDVQLFFSKAGVFF